MRTLSNVMLALIASGLAGCASRRVVPWDRAELLERLRGSANETRAASEEQRVAGVLRMCVLLCDLLDRNPPPISPSDMTELSAPRDLKVGRDYMERRALCVLAYALRDHSAEVRATALWAASWMGAPASCLEDGIRECTGDESPIVRSAAAKAIYFACGDAELAVDVCVDLLANGSDSIRMEVAYTLVQMGSVARNARKQLEACRDTSQSSSLSRMCQWALDRVSNDGP